MPAATAVRRSTRAPEPPPLRLFTVNQLEAAHPGVAGRVRGWIKRADAGDPAFIALRRAVVRVGRSVLLDEIKFRDFCYQRSAAPPTPGRNPEGINAPARRSRRAAA